MPSTILVTNPNADLYGSSRMLAESVIGFRRAGLDVVAVLPYDGPLAGELRSHGARVEICVTPTLRKQFLSPVGLVRLAALAVGAIPRAVRLLRRTRPAVVYVNTITDPFWVVVARLCGIPVVCHVHEAETSAPAPVRRALAAPLLAASGLIANSRFTAAVPTASFGRLAERFHVVHNGLTSPPRPRSPRAEIDGPIRLLFVGRLSERKGVEDAVDAVGMLVARGADVRLDVVGEVFPGYEWFEDSLRRRISDAGLDRHVTLCGFDPDVWSHLADCDIVLVPSRLDEGFGNAAVEATLAARPVIATGTSGLLEAVEGYASARSVPPTAPSAIADAVDGLVADWDRIRLAAVDDATIAAARHDPDRYRTAVTTVVEAFIA